MQKILDRVNGFNLRTQENKLIVIFLISLIVYVIFVLFGDVQKILDTALHFNWAILPLLLTLTIFNYLLRAKRFHYYLKQIEVNIPYMEALRIFLSGLSMTVTPGKTGEVIKAYLLKKSHDASITHVIPVLVFERMTDGLAMIFLGIAGLFIVRQSVLFFVFAIASVIGFILIIKFQKYFLHIVKNLELRFPRVKVLNFFEIFFENSEKLLNVKNFSYGILLGIIAWFFEGLALALIIGQFISIDALYNLAVSLFIFSFSSIAGFFVFIPGGIGVAEGSITYFLTSLFPLPLSTAVFITILFRFITLWFGVGIGLSVLIWSLKKNK